jgi:hypothetical protein
MLLGWKTRYPPDLQVDANRQSLNTRIATTREPGPAHRAG